MATSEFMRVALAEAQLARGRTARNPPVGAALVRDGVVVGSGHTQPPGQAHAEIMALRAAGPRAAGAALYVTLEPCCHHGRTPPCTDAIIAAGVRAVVAATVNPNPKVAGQGLAQLRAAGLDVTTGDGAPESEAILRPFFCHIATGRPYVTAKWAMTLDGKIADAAGDARWVSGPAALAWAHELRDVVDAVVVGVGTVLADDPQLTVRLEQPGARRTPRAGRPLRVVLDSRCRLPLDARLLSPELAPGTLVCTTAAAPAAARDAIAGRGAEVLVLPADEAGHVALATVLQALGRRDILHVLVEGGAAVHASLLSAGLADAVAVVIAPKLVGGCAAPGPVGGPGLARRMTEALTLAAVRVTMLGADVLIEGRLAVQDLAPGPAHVADVAEGP